ncbi:MAG: hypothetical protein WC637_09960 [Victivallales bacterium]|jgi:hypothetical protein
MIRFIRVVLLLFLLQVVVVADEVDGNSKIANDAGASKDVLQKLHKEPLTSFLGLSQTKLIKALSASTFLKPTNSLDIRQDNSLTYYSSPPDGIRFISIKDQVFNVDVCSDDVDGFQTFRGNLPLGLKWSDTTKDVIKILGLPNDSGSVPSDFAYGMAYFFDDLTLAIMFTAQDSGRIKIVRIYKKKRSAEELSELKQQVLLNAKSLLSSINNDSPMETQIVKESINKDEGWGFVTIKFPSGTEIDFSLFGAKPGEAINSAKRYKLKKVDDVYELYFPGDAKLVHRFGPDGKLVQVRVTQGGVEFCKNKFESGWTDVIVIGEKR